MNHALSAFENFGTPYPTHGKMTTLFPGLFLHKTCEPRPPGLPSKSEDCAPEKWNGLKQKTAKISEKARKS